MLQTMDSRKRPLSPDGATSSSLNSKKRAMNSSSPRPKANGDLPHDESKDENLEAFRKEAIWRRMRHYARELERAQATIGELEQRKNMCEAGIAAMEACWNLLLDTLRSLVRSEKLPPADDRTRELFDLVRRSADEEEREDDEDEDDDDESTDYQIALQDLVASSQSLIAQVAQLAPHSPPDAKDLRNKLHMAQAEANSLRSEVQLLRARLADSRADSESLRTSLQNVENRLERAKSQTINAKDKKPEVNGSAAATPPPPVKEETPMEPAIPTPPNGTTASAESDGPWKALAESREQQLVALTTERLSLTSEINRLKLLLSAPPDEVVNQHSAYRILQEQANAFKVDVDEYKTRWTVVKEELDNLKANQRAMHEEAISKTQATIDELHANLQKREADCLRLRESRDAITAEVSVRRARDAERTNGVAQLKTLVETRGERIAVLMSEIRRLKATIAAQTGDQDLLQYVMGLSVSGEPEQGAQVEPSYVADLQARLESAQARLQAAEHPGHAEMELAKYRKAFGPWEDVFADLKENAVAAKEAELKVANLKCMELEAALNDVYSEVDKLSVAWETLDKQNKLKVFDLVALEERLLKATTEKAKADNKYFQVMKVKETQEAECKTLSRNMARQMSVLERNSESLNNLKAQLAVADKEATIRGQMIQALTDRIEEGGRETRELKIRLESEQRRVTEAEKLRNVAEAAANEARAQLAKAQEDVVRQVDEAKRLAAPATKRDALQKENDGLKAVLRCSACHINFRSHTLLKCMHTFCKGCIDARVSTRQRKCPACNLAFATQDVQLLYFQ